MQSIFALAGVAGLAAAAFAPQYEDNSRATTQEAAVPTAYAAPSVFRTVDTIPSYSSSTINAGFAPAPYYHSSSTINAGFTPAPYYHSSSTINAGFTPAPYSSEAPRFTSPLTWSTTKYIRTSAYTTYCSEATTLSFNTKTYTVTAATTLTVTDCYNGCSVVKPLPTTTIEQTTPVIKTTHYETYLPQPTTVTFSASTYTVTQATTLTIPQKITTSSVFRTVIPVQPTFAPVYNAPINSTFSPVVPIPTYKSEVSPYEPSEAPVVPAPTYEAPVAPIPATSTLNAIVPPYPTGPAKSPVYPTATGTGKIYATSPALYTGAANRVGAGALMAVAGFAVLL